MCTFLFETAPKDKIDFNIRITLVASETWVQVGSYFDLSYLLRSFVIKVDPTGLSAGVHTARIRAYDSADISKGTLFEVPITVIQPLTVDPTNNIINLNQSQQVFKASTICRYFIVVPKNVTWAGKFILFFPNLIFLKIFLL